MAFTKGDILELTDLLRTSADPFWVRMRALLSERGVNVTASILVESFPDDACFEFGVLIAQDEKVIQYGFDYPGKDISEGVFTEWNDVTPRLREVPYRKSVDTGMGLKREQ